MLLECDVHFLQPIFDSGLISLLSVQARWSASMWLPVYLRFVDRAVAIGSEWTAHRIAEALGCALSCG
jgi:hypothetical protein